MSRKQEKNYVKNYIESLPWKKLIEVKTVQDLERIRPAFRKSESNRVLRPSLADQLERKILDSRDGQPIFMKDSNNLFETPYLAQNPVEFAEKVCFGDTDGDVVIPAGRELTEADLTPAIPYPEQYWIDLEDVNLDDVGPLKLD